MMFPTRVLGKAIRHGVRSIVDVLLPPGSRDTSNVGSVCAQAIPDTIPIIAAALSAVRITTIFYGKIRRSFYRNSLGAKSLRYSRQLIQVCPPPVSCNVSLIPYLLSVPFSCSGVRTTGSELP